MIKAPLLGIFIVAFCGLLYELLIATFASYALGDTVAQFSITIGLFIGSMGLGSFFSKFFTKHLKQKFVVLQYTLGMLGGISILFLTYLLNKTPFVGPLIYCYLIIIGTLIGLELPLLARMLENKSNLKDILSHSLSIDNLGSLLASILFPLILIPSLGLFWTSLLAGGLNILAGMLLSKGLSSRFHLTGIVLLLSLVFLGLTNTGFQQKLTAHFYQDPIIHSQQTKYQKIVLTQFKQNLRLYLNGQLQFNSFDEHRYHETLVHTPILFHSNPKSALILGGGDGLAIRELLKYDSITQITLVELDPEMIELAKENPALLRLNKSSMHSKRVQVVTQDAFQFLRTAKQEYDIIIADLPDPNDLGLSKLYSREFYLEMKRVLNENGIFITQATSPHIAQRTFWTIHKTLLSLSGHVLPIHLNVPSFGEWGFILYSQRSLKKLGRTVPDTRFFTSNQLDIMSFWPQDLTHKKPQSNISLLLDPKIYQSYSEEVRQAGFQ